MDIGLHIADFTWTGGVPALGDTLARHARDAEDAGIARITVMDHFWQLGGNLGPYEHEMLEAYTTLGFLAAHTRTVLLHTLVTSAVNRSPGILAKQIATLDVLSDGRAGLGVGAGGSPTRRRGSGSRSRRSRSASSGWRRPSRSACRCGPGRRSRSTAGTTNWPAPSARRSRSSGRARTS